MKTAAEIYFPSREHRRTARQSTTKNVRLTARSYLSSFGASLVNLDFLSFSFIRHVLVYAITDDSFSFSQDATQNIESTALDVKNVNKFPYIAVGTLTVKFPIGDEDYQYTCFLIDTNVVVTLASNLNDKNKGGKAKSIISTFSEEKVKWENVFFEEENSKKKKKESLDSVGNSKLAVILYEDNIGSEWIGVEGGKEMIFQGEM